MSQKTEPRSRIEEKAVVHAADLPASGLRSARRFDVPRPTPLLSYASAVGLAVAAFLLRLALLPYTGNSTPFLTFFLAVLLSAFYGGGRAGLLCVALSAFASLYFLPPVGKFAVSRFGDVWNLVVFVGISSAIVLLLDSLRRAKERAEAHAEEAEQRQAEVEALQSELERRLLEIERFNERLHRALYEASHRIKNQLQVLAATADMIVMDETEVVDADEVRRLIAQIRAIAATHDLLTLDARADGTADHISLKALLERILLSLQQTTDRHTMRYTLDDVSLPIKEATSLALLTNEAVSNGIKHGGSSIEVTVKIDGGQIRMNVRDDGSGFPPDFHADHDANTGLELLLALTKIDLRGSAEFSNRPEGGGRVAITCPLPD